MSIVVVVGSGGREACVAYTFAKSPLVSKVFVLPGNAGTREQDGSKICNLALESTSNASYCKAIQSVKADLVFIGPEAPLVQGLVDDLTKLNIKCFGPTKAASQLEASKAFSKDFFLRHQLPTAEYHTFDNAEMAKKYVENNVDWKTNPIVVKASGLCAGKGVVLPTNTREALEAIHDIMVAKKFGEEAGKQVVIESLLLGEEVSVLAFCDGTHSVCMPPAQDHKRIGDGDTGLNTGGMGAYCPAPCVSDKLFAEIQDIVQRTLTGLAKEGTPFVGVLFAGFMLTANGPSLLEYNVRMGDPETQVVLPLLTSDLFTVCTSCVEGTLKDCKVEFNTGSQACATVVMAAKGYPEDYPVGMPIEIESDKEALIFHAGTKFNPTTQQVVSSGGRVLSVTGLGSTLEKALEVCYRGVSKVKFDNSYFRKDIGHRALPHAKKLKQ